MKWLVNKTSPTREMHELWHENKKLLTLDYHPFTNAARIESTGEKRVFHIRKEGFLRNKTIVRNEYGIKMGQLGPDKLNAGKGFIELNDEKFTYTIDNNLHPHLSIHRENDTEKPFVTCELETTSHHPSVKFKKEKELSPVQHFLLMSLCWYMFLPAAKENMAITG